MRISHIFCYGCSCDYVPAKPAGYKEVGLRNHKVNLPRSSDLAHATGRKQAKPAYTALQEQGCWGGCEPHFRKNYRGNQELYNQQPHRGSASNSKGLARDQSETLGTCLFLESLCVRAGSHRILLSLDLAEREAGFQLVAEVSVFGGFGNDSL